MISQGNYKFPRDSDRSRTARIAEMRRERDRFIEAKIDEAQGRPRIYNSRGESVYYEKNQADREVLDRTYTDVAEEIDAVAERILDFLAL